MPWKRKLPILTLLILIGLACSVNACQTFNISILAPTDLAATDAVKAATLPVEWTPTPIPENLRPLEALTPLAPEDYTQGPEWDSPDIVELFGMNNFQLGEFVNFAKVEGELLIVGDNAGVLTIMDLTDLTNPVPLANVDLGFEDRELSVEPGDPFSPPVDLIGSEIQDVEFDSGLLYVITIHRLLVLDIRISDAPILINQIELAPRLTDLEVKDSYLRVLRTDSALDLVQLLELDASKPDELTIEHEANLPGSGAGLANMTGDLAYVTERKLETAEQFKLYALTDQRNPVKVGEAYGAPAFRAWVDGDFAYLSTARIEEDDKLTYRSAAASIWVVDISDPEDISSFSYIWAPDVAMDFYRTQETAYIIGGNLYSIYGNWKEQYWMAVADLSDPAYPVVNRTLELPGQGLHVTGARGVTFVAAGQGGLQILRPEEGEALRLFEGEDFRAKTWLDAALVPGPRGTPTPTVQSPIGSSSNPTATFSPSYMAFNIDEHDDFTVYWKRELWESAVEGLIAIEDFEWDYADYGELAFPYLTGHRLILNGKSSAQIINSPSLLPSGNLLHLRDWEEGLTIGFPKDESVHSFGFDYKPTEEWRVSFDRGSVTIPKGRRGFVGIILKEGALLEFTVSSNSSVQGGLSMDNISYLLTRLWFPSTRATATAQASLFTTSTPAPGAFED